MPIIGYSTFNANINPREIASFLKIAQIYMRENIYVHSRQRGCFMTDQKEKTHFSYQHFLNMDISHIVPLKFLKCSIHAGKTLLEGRVSQNVDKGFSFIVCWRYVFDFFFFLEKNTVIRVFFYKIKTMT